MCGTGGDNARGTRNKNRCRYIETIIPPKCSPFDADDPPKKAIIAALQVDIIPPSDSIPISLFLYAPR